MKASLILLFTLTTVLHASNDKTSISTAFGHDGYFFLRGMKPAPDVLHYRLGHSQSFLNTKHTTNYRLSLFPNPSLSTVSTNAYLGWFEGYWEMEDKTVLGFKNFDTKDQVVFVLYEKVITGQVETVRISEKNLRGWSKALVTAIEGLFPSINNPKEYLVRGDPTLGTTIQNIRAIPLQHGQIMTEKIDLDLDSILTSHKTQTTVLIHPSDYLGKQLERPTPKTFTDYVDLIERVKVDSETIKQYEEMLVEDSKEYTMGELEDIEKERFGVSGQKRSLRRGD